MVMKDGEPSEVVNHYLKSTYDTTVKTVLKDRMDRTGNGSIKATGIHFGTQSNAIGGYWVTGENATIELDYECIDNQAYKNIEVALCVHKMDQSKFLYLGTKILKMNILEIHGSGTFACNIPKLPVEPGRYVVHTEFKQNGIIVDYVDSAAMIEVMDGDFYGTGVIWPYGGFLCDYAWTHRPAQH
jgi:lipopolysaccharide transport system ATP-binding protein